MTVGDVARRFEVSRPAISQHLAVLKDAGLVDPPRGGGRALYAVRDEAVLAARREVVALADELPGAPDGSDPVSSVAPEPARAPAQRHDVIAVEVGAAATVETVFGHLVEPQLITRWLGVRATADARPGGEFRVELSAHDAAAGTYVEVAEPSGVVFTWGQEGGTGALAPGATEVEVTLGVRQAGAAIRLEHRGLPAEVRAAHLASWAHHLGGLAAAAERSDRA